VNLVLWVLPHIEYQLKVVIRETMWIEQRLLNFPNYILMRSCVYIKRCWWNFFHGQSMGGFFGYTICQLTGGNFFLNHAIALLQRPGLGTGDDARLWSFQNLHLERRNLFLNWAVTGIKHGIREGMK
jgi:hypothetical protein